MLDQLKALADATRLRLMALLQHGPLTVTELVEILGMGQSRISRHLRILMEAGLVRVERQGTWAFYRTDERREWVAELIAHLAQRFSELEGRTADLDALAVILERRRRESRSFFDRHARSFDTLVEQLLPTPDVSAELLQVLRPAETLVEVGAGTGPLLSCIAERSQRFVVVDHSGEMLAEARKRAASLGLQGGSFRLGEMETLPLDACEADALVASMVLHHAARPEAVLGEFARVLRPGGQLVLVDLLRHEKEWVRERLSDLWLGFDPQDVARFCEAEGFGAIRTRVIQAREPAASVFLLTAEKTSPADL